MEFMLPQSVQDEESEYDEILNKIMLCSVNEHWQNFLEFAKKFRALPIDERVSFAFDFFESINGFPKVQQKSIKSPAEALKLKNLGNDKYGRGLYLDALKLYSQSVAVAPAGSAELAVAYANRSAVLYQLERYQACVVDINRALKENYPEASKQKLLDRKQKCCSILVERNALESGDVNGVEHLSLKDKVPKMKTECQFDEDALDLDYSGKFPVPESKFENENISNASEKIKIEVNSKFGRHIVAVEDIAVGEMISIEKPYASVLWRNCLYSHCSNCSLRCESLIPCPSCSAEMYCSRRCRDDAWTRFHRIECQMHSHLQDLPLVHALWLEIRILMIITKQGADLETLMKHPLFKNPMKRVYDHVPAKFDSQDSVHFLNLINSKVYNENDPDSMLLEGPMEMYRVLTVCSILRHTTYFGSTMVENAQELDVALLEKEKYVGRLFFKLMLSVPIYTFGVAELLQKKVACVLSHSGGMSAVGSGMYMFHSLFSHSCHVNVSGSFHKDTMVTQAIQPIKAGQQLFVSYSAQFTVNPRAYRQYQLQKNYQFDCRCEACEYDWPTIDYASKEWVLLPNSHISSKKIKYYKEKLYNFFSTSTLLIEVDNKWFKFCCEFMTMFHENFKIPCQDYIACIMAFQLLLQSRGNNYVYTRDSFLMSL